MLAAGALEGCRRLQAAGWTLAVASNQPAAAKGKATLAQLEEVRTTGSWRCSPRAVYGSTPGTPASTTPTAVVPELRGPCRCRKPEPGMLLDILEELRTPSPARPG